MYLYLFAFLAANTHRYLKPVLYIVVLGISVMTRSLFFPFVFGLLVSELATNNVFTWIKSKKWLNFPLQSFLAAFVLAYAVPTLPEIAIDMESWFSSNSHFINPGDFLYFFVSMPGIDLVLVRNISACFLLVFLELNETFHKFFTYPCFTQLGKYSFGIP